MDTDQRTCFVISPIGEDGSPTRARADKMLHFIIRHILEPRGYEVKRADTISEPGLITNQIVQRIVDCDLMVADLSEHNPNVFYELAIRHGLRKPYVQIIDAGYKIPFDTSGIRTISVDLTDLYSVEKAREELVAQVDAIENEGFIVESPISIAFDLDSLRSSGRADENLLANLVEEVGRLRKEMATFREPVELPNDVERIHLIPSTLEGLLDIMTKNKYPRTSKQLMENFEVKSYKAGLIELKKVGSFPDEGSYHRRINGALKKLFGVPWRVVIEEAV